MGPDAAREPLVVAANPRYVTVASDQRKAVYLTGSYIWNNLHDGMGPGAGCGEPAERLDYDAYLEFLAEHGHNFIRLWRWEQFRSQAAGGRLPPVVTPQPWPRTGPGAHRRQAQVRPGPVRGGVLQAAPRPGRRRRPARHLRGGDVL